MDVAFAAKFLGALFAILNPFLVLPVFLALTADNTVQQQRRMAVLVLIYAGIMCVTISVGGGRIIGFFGVTVESFRVAGGIVLLGIALAMLNGQPITSHERGEHEKRVHEAAGGSPDDNITFYPLTFPMIVGPGTIATLIIYSAQVSGPEQVTSFGVVLAAILIALFVVLYFASSIGRLMSAKMRVIVTRLMGMVLAAIAVEMVFVGAKIMLPGLA